VSISTAVVAATGFVYEWTAYFAESDDPDALVNHPLQPDVQHLHVLTAPLLVFALGLVWSAHVWPRVRSGYRERRASGLTLFALCSPMVASGYLLQTASDTTWSEIWTWIHVGASIVWTIAFLAHWIGARRPTIAGGGAARTRA